MEKEYCVYMHIFPNGKRYIGVTCCSVNRRWQKGYGYKSQTLMYRAICKYGWDNIKHIIIKDKLSAKQAGELEVELIAKYRSNKSDNGYNVDDGGLVGYHLKKETKAKISKANSGANNGMYGHEYTDEERQYMSEHSVWKGKKHTEETRKKISEYAKTHPEKYSRKDAKHPRAKAVLQFNLNGIFMKEYKTAKEASEETGVLRSSICSCVKKKIKTAGGYMWRYKENEIISNIKPVEPHNFNNNSKKWHMKKINQYTIDGLFIRSFDSISEANEFIGVRKDNGGVSGVVRGTKRTAHGYIWRYADAE